MRCQIDRLVEGQRGCGNEASVTVVGRKPKLWADPPEEEFMLCRSCARWFEREFLMEEEVN